MSLRVARESGIAKGMTFYRITLGAVAMAVLPACGEKEQPTAAAPSGPATGAPPVVSAPAAPAEGAPTSQSVRKIFWTEELLHTEIKHYNPSYEGGGQFSIENGVPVAVVLAGQKVDSLRAFEGIPLQALDISDTGVGDISPLKGLPLRQLMLERTKVSDLSPLKGMKLEMFYATNTPIVDISALQGMPLTEVNLAGCKVQNIGPLAQSPVSMLWLTDCPVEDISALKTMPLVSVTLHRTKVKDLSPLTGTALQRLHIAETPVMDLSPLKGMQLTRLVFTPANIKSGMDVARELPVQEIGTRFDDETKDLQPPAAFWANLPNAAK